MPGYIPTFDALRAICPGCGGYVEDPEPIWLLTLADGSARYACAENCARLVSGQRRSQP